MQHRQKRHAVCLVSAALLAGSAWLGNCTIEPTRVVIRSPYLPEEFSGLRVVQISDLHGKEFDADSRYLLRNVRLAKPDLIAITGDLMDEYTNDAILRPLLEGLCQIAPVFYVTGNHEWSLSKTRRTAFFQLLTDCGVYDLCGKSCRLEKGGASILIAGVDDPNGPADSPSPGQLVRRIRSDYGEDAFLLMLSHRNDQLELWSNLGVDAVLSGHAHGGIVRLPILGPVFGTHVNFFPRDAEGLYRKGRTQLVVSRGLGASKKLPLRIGNRPELVTVILERENS